MAVTLYSYTKAVNPQALADEIAADAGIIIALDHIDTDGTALDIYMADVLPGAEETALNDVVTAHANPAYPTVNRCVSGSGIPNDNIGNDNDICIDSAAQTYYKMVSGTWTGPFALGNVQATDDLSDVDTTTTAPVADDHLVYDGTNWVPVNLASGAASTTLASWTLDTGDLYYADFAHNVGTTEIAVFLYDSATLKLVEAEDITVTDANTIRVWVRGNAESLVCNVISGHGPTGATGPQGPSGGGATDMDSLTDADTTTVAPVSGDALVFDGTNWVPAKKTTRIGHTWAISGEIKVAAGDTDFVLPFFVSLPSGQAAKIVKARYVINGGTNCNVKVQKNGSDVTGFTNITVTTTVAETDPADVALADNDKLALVVNSVSAVPVNLSFTLFVEHSV